MLVRCSVCRGQKKIKGLGCMLRKCVACSGAGYVEQDAQEDNIETASADIVDNAHPELDVSNEKPKTRRKGNPNWRKKDVEA